MPTSLLSLPREILFLLCTLKPHCLAPLSGTNKALNACLTANTTIWVNCAFRSQGYSFPSSFPSSPDHDSRNKESIKVLDEILFRGCRSVPVITFLLDAAGGLEYAELRRLVPNAPASVVEMLVERFVDTQYEKTKPKPKPKRQKGKGSGKGKTDEVSIKLKTKRQVRREICGNLQELLTVAAIDHHRADVARHLLERWSVEPTSTQIYKSAEDGDFELLELLLQHARAYRLDFAEALRPVACNGDDAFRGKAVEALLAKGAFAAGDHVVGAVQVKDLELVKRFTGVVRWQIENREMILAEMEVEKMVLAAEREEEEDDEEEDDVCNKEEDLEVNDDEEEDDDEGDGGDVVSEVTAQQRREMSNFFPHGDPYEDDFDDDSEAGYDYEPEDYDEDFNDFEHDFDEDYASDYDYDDYAYGMDEHVVPQHLRSQPLSPAFSFAAFRPAINAVIRSFQDDVLLHFYRDLRIAPTRENLSTSVMSGNTSAMMMIFKEAAAHVLDPQPSSSSSSASSSSSTTTGQPSPATALSANLLPIRRRLVSSAIQNALEIEAFRLLFETDPALVPTQRNLLDAIGFGRFDMLQCLVDHRRRPVVVAVNREHDDHDSDKYGDLDGGESDDELYTPIDFSDPMLQRLIANKRDARERADVLAIIDGTARAGDDGNVTRIAGKEKKVEAKFDNAQKSRRPVIQFL